jgi:hypothetical protein
LLASGCGSPGGQGTTDGGASFTIVGAASDGRVGLAYLAQLSLHGTVPAAVTWSSGGVLPPGLAVTGSAGGAELSGTPTKSGDFDFTVIAQASSGEREILELQLTVDPEVTLSGTAPDGVEGVPYSATLTFAGTPRGDVRWTLSALPSGLLFDEDAATLHGLAAAGTYSISVQAADNLGVIGQLQLSLVIAPALTIDAVSLPDGTVSIPYQAAFQFHGGLGFHLWSISAGALPPGVSLDGNAGVLGGVPTASGSFDFTVGLAGGAGSFAQLAATIVVRRNLAIAAAAIPGAGKIAADYSGTVTATGAVSDADYAWSISSGALPGGLVLGSTGGVASITGKPAETGGFAFTVAVTLPGGERAEAAFQLQVAENPPRIVSTALPDAIWSVDYAATVSAESAVGGPFQWLVAAGALPPGLTLSGTDSMQVTLSGRPRFAGAFTFTLAFSDARQPAAADFSVQVGSLSQLEVLAVTLERARAGRPYAAALESRRASGAVSFSLERGSLPPGLTLDAVGSIQGTPDTPGSFNFGVVATDAGGGSARQRFSILVVPDHYWLAAASSTTSNGAQSVAVRDVGGAAPGPLLPLAGDLQPVFQITFSPNPDRFSFMTSDFTRGSLYVAGLTAAPSLVKIVDGELRGDRIDALRWSPDGTRFAYAQEVGTGSLQFAHFIAPADDPAAGTALTDQLCGYGGLWSPDSSLYATTSVDGSNLFVSDGTSTRTIALDDNLAFASLIAWSPDSSLLLISAFDLDARGDRIYALFAADDGPGALPLTPADEPVNPNDVTVSADGAGLAVGSVSGAAVFACDLRSAQLAPMQRLAGTSPFPGWSPDSRRLAVTTTSDGSQVDVRDRDQPGAPVSLAVTVGHAGFARLSWAADSQSLLASTPDGVSALPAGGGAASLLVSGAVRDFDTLGGALIYSNESGVYEPGATLDATPEPWNLAVAQQRRAAFYLHFDDGTTPGKLWMVDLSGPTPAAPMELLDFGQGTVLYDVSDAHDVGPQ